MRTRITGPALALLLATAATPLRASKPHLTLNGAEEPTPQVAGVVQEERSRLRLEEVKIEEGVTAASADDGAQWPERGSFWWTVGVIVVAGVILAILL